jgi:hypothetical protein
MKTDMKIRSLAITAVICAITIGVAEEKPGAPDMAEMMKKLEAAGAPGVAHQALAPLIGEWEAEVKTWMAPDAPPTVTKGTAKAAWVMEGRFIQEEFSGEFMGKPFRGLSLIGYDNLKQKYTNFWVDNMNTAMFTSQGTAGQDGKIIGFEGKYDCPITGEKDMVMNQILRIVSADKHVFEMHDVAKGMKTMEITYTRK